MIEVYTMQIFLMFHIFKKFKVNEFLIKHNSIESPDQTMIKNMSFNQFDR